MKKRSIIFAFVLSLAVFVGFGIQEAEAESVVNENLSQSCSDCGYTGITSTGENDNSGGGSGQSLSKEDKGCSVLHKSGSGQLIRL